MMPSKTERFIQEPLKKDTKDVVAEGIYLNAAFMHIVTSLVGSSVQIETTDGKQFEGIFTTFSPTFQLLVRLVHDVSQLNDNNLLPTKDSIKERMIFEPSDVVRICANVDLEGVTKSGFATDKDISGYNNNGDVGERQLEKWEPDELLEDDDWSCVTGDGLTNHSRGGGGGWSAEDMFRTNKDLGVQSSFSEDLSQYTSVQVPQANTPEMIEKHKQAKKLAEEIENGPAYRKHNELENDDTEREIVQRSPSNSSVASNSGSAGRYMPPNQRRQQEQTVRRNDNRGPDVRGRGGGRDPGQGRGGRVVGEQYYNQNQNQPQRDYHNQRGGHSRRGPRGRGGGAVYYDDREVRSTTRTFHPPQQQQQQQQHEAATNPPSSSPRGGTTANNTNAGGGFNIGVFDPRDLPDSMISSKNDNWETATNRNRNRRSDQGGPPPPTTTTSNTTNSGSTMQKTQSIDDVTNLNTSAPPPPQQPSTAPGTHFTVPKGNRGAGRGVRPLESLKDFQHKFNLQPNVGHGGPSPRGGPPVTTNAPPPPRLPPQQINSGPGPHPLMNSNVPPPHPPTSQQQQQQNKLTQQQVVNSHNAQQMAAVAVAQHMQQQRQGPPPSSNNQQQPVMTSGPPPPPSHHHQQSSMQSISQPPPNTNAPPQPSPRNMAGASYGAVAAAGTQHQQPQQGYAMMRGPSAPNPNIMPPPQHRPNQPTVAQPPPGQNVVQQQQQQQQQQMMQQQAHVARMQQAAQQHQAAAAAAATAQMQQQPPPPAPQQNTMPHSVQVPPPQNTGGGNGGAASLQRPPGPQMPLPAPSPVHMSNPPPQLPPQTMSMPPPPAATPPQTASSNTVTAANSGAELEKVDSATSVKSNLNPDAKEFTPSWSPATPLSSNTMPGAVSSAGAQPQQVISVPTPAATPQPPTYVTPALSTHQLIQHQQQQQGTVQLQPQPMYASIPPTYANSPQLYQPTQVQSPYLTQANNPMVGNPYIPVAGGNTAAQMHPIYPIVSIPNSSPMVYAAPNGANIRAPTVAAPPPNNNMVRKTSTPTVNPQQATGPPIMATQQTAQQLGTASYVVPYPNNAAAIQQRVMQQHTFALEQQAAAQYYANASQMQQQQQQQQQQQPSQHNNGTPQPTSGTQTPAGGGVGGQVHQQQMSVVQQQQQIAAMGMHPNQPVIANPYQATSPHYPYATAFPGQQIIMVPQYTTSQGIYQQTPYASQIMQQQPGAYLVAAAPVQQNSAGYYVRAPLSGNPGGGVPPS